MRSRGVRLDLFICMLLAALMFWGIWQVADYFGVLEKAFDAIGNAVSEEKEVADGEVGGFATEDTPIVSTMEEISQMAQDGKVFTIETTRMKYTNYGVFQGGNYDWRILRLEGNYAIAVKLNTKKIKRGENIDDMTLPVGQVIPEAPAALDEMQKCIEGTDDTLIIDAYIDMDGEAKATYISSTMQATMIIIWIISAVIPLLLFALYIVSVLWIHSFFAKRGIFPPVFPGRENKKKKG